MGRSRVKGHCVMGAASFEEIVLTGAAFFCVVSSLCFDSRFFWGHLVFGALRDHFAG